MARLCRLEMHQPQATIFRVLVLQASLSMRRLIQASGF